MTLMSATKRFSLAAGVIVASIVGLIVWSLSGTTAYYRTPSELTSGSFDDSRTVRVAGKVVPGSIETAGTTTRFAVSDGSSQVDVTTEDALPDTFAADVEVVAEGAMGSGAFSASSVLVKCPSKMEAKLASEG
jgi:cytochrome c-type biogenesis protein CcmE